MTTIRFYGIPAALSRAKERADASDSDDEFLTLLLNASAGTEITTGLTCYRPFYAAARFLLQSRRDQMATSADGMAFTGMIRPIVDLLQLQRALDEGLEIPAGFSADELLSTVAPEAAHSHRYTSGVAAIKVLPIA